MFVVQVLNQSFLRKNNFSFLNTSPHFLPDSFSSTSLINENILLLHSYPPPLPCLSCLNLTLSFYFFSLFCHFLSLAHSPNLLLLFATLSRVFLDVFVLLRFHIYFCIGSVPSSNPPFIYCNPLDVSLCHGLILLLTISLTCVTSFMATDKTVWMGRRLVGFWCWWTN